MKTWVLAVGLVLALSAGPLAADGPAGFVRIDGVKGESRARPGWIEALTLDLSCAALVPGQTAHAGATRTPRLTFTHRVDGTSPVLQRAGTSSQRLAKAYVEQQGARYELTEVQVTRVARTGSGEPPVEAVTIVFGQCARR